AGDEALGLVETGWTPIPASALHVANQKVGVAAADERGFRSGIDVLRPRIAQLGRESLGEALAPKRLQGVVVAPGVIGYAEDRAVAAVRTSRVGAQLADRNETGRRVGVEQVGINFVEADAGEVCAGVGRGDRRGHRKLSAIPRIILNETDAAISEIGD